MEENRKNRVGFMMQNVNRSQQPPDKEVAEYVASKLGMPAELSSSVRISKKIIV